MKQRAITAGVLSNPYQYVEAGQEFDRDELMRWAVVVESEVKESPQSPRKGRKGAETAQASNLAEDVI